MPNVDSTWCTHQRRLAGITSMNAELVYPGLSQMRQIFRRSVDVLLRDGPACRQRPRPTWNYMVFGKEIKRDMAHRYAKSGREPHQYVEASGSWHRHDQHVRKIIGDRSFLKEGESR